MSKKTSNILSEALAEAKEVRRLATEAAKDALMEQFQDSLENVIASKLHEADEEDEDEEEVEEAKAYDDDLDEADSDNQEDEDEDDIKEMSEDELDTVIAELEKELSEADEDEDLEATDTADQEDELDDEDIDEAKKSDDDDEDIDEMKDSDDEDEKSLDELIEDFLKEESDEDEDEDIDEAKKSDDDDEDDLDEAAGPELFDALIALGGSAGIVGSAVGITKILDKLRAQADKNPNSRAAKALKVIDQLGAAASDSIKHEVAREYKGAIKELQEAIDDVNLMNSKLLYTNKIFRNFDLADKQKRAILENFDRANTINEAKLVYGTLINSFKTTVKRKRKFSSAITESTKPRLQADKIIDNTFRTRLQKLAGI